MSMTNEIREQVFDVFHKAEMIGYLLHNGIVNTLDMDWRCIPDDITDRMLDWLINNGCSVCIDPLGWVDVINSNNESKRFLRAVTIELYDQYDTTPRQVAIAEACVWAWQQLNKGEQ